MKQPAAEPLRFPRGVPFPRAGELPADAPTDAYERIGNARITTGYTVRARDGILDQYLFEANAHADMVWPLVKEIADSILPVAAAPIVSLKGEQPILGSYTTREAAIAVFEPFVDSLAHDGFLEFGIIFQRAGCTNEVFVPSAKYLQIWTTYPEIVRRILQNNGLPELPGLQFIDEYARITDALTLEDGRASWPIVYEELQRAFERLPVAPDIDASASR